ncbi:MAG: diacylglycerol kinase family protein [Chloroflexota bacterium]
MPAASALILLNPIAGGGRASRLVHRIAALSGTSAVLVVGASTDHVSELARDAAKDGYSRVIAAGGDGTVQAVINGLMATGEGRPQLGIVPIGSGNDLSRSLGMPRSLREAVDLALHSACAPMDLALARAEGSYRWFGSAAGVGFDAQVATAMAGRRGRWQRGKIGYLATTLAELRRTRNHRVRLSARHGDAEWSEELTILLAVVANGAYYGGGMRIAPDATAGDGLLDLITIADVSRMTALRQLPNLYRGTHLRHPAVNARRLTAIEIEPLDGDPLPLHLDGEPWQRTPVRIELHPAAIAVAGSLRAESASLRG